MYCIQIELEPLEETNTQSSHTEQFKLDDYDEKCNRNAGWNWALDSLNEEILSSFVWWKVKKNNTRKIIFYFMFFFSTVCLFKVNGVLYLFKKNFFSCSFRFFLLFCIIFTLHNNGNTIQNPEKQRIIYNKWQFFVRKKRPNKIQKRTGIKNF